jgi:hypothetical protein
LAFDVFFFVLVSIANGNILKEKKLEYCLPIFHAGCKCRQGVGPGYKRKHFLDQVFKPHILDNNYWIWAFFFFIGKYLS